MTLDEQILYAKKEKEFNNEVNIIVSKLYEAAEITEVLDENAIPMMKILKVKHSEPAEMLREADYNNALAKMINNDLSETDKYFLSNILGHEVISESKSEKYSIVKELREHIEENIMKTESDDFNVVMEGYSKMAEVYVLFESTRETEIRNCKSWNSFIW